MKWWWLQPGRVGRGQLQDAAPGRKKSLGASWFNAAGLRDSTMRGSVTAEFAVVLPAITALLALLLLGAGAGILQLRLEEGARAGARALARGESIDQAADIAKTMTGGVGSISVDLVGGYATVTLTGRVSGPLAAMVPWQQSAKATARMENFEPAQGLGGTRSKPHNTAPADPDWEVLAARSASGSESRPALRKTALWRWVHTSSAGEGPSGIVSLGNDSIGPFPAAGSSGLWLPCALWLDGAFYA